MTRRFLLLALLLTLLTAGPARAGGPPPDARPEQGTYLGLLFSRATRGVVVTHVLPGSPADRAGVQRQDLLLKYGPEPVRDCEQLARLICEGKPGDRVRLALERDGKALQLEATLELGLALRIADARPETQPDSDVPRGVAKPGAPPSISVKATPLPTGQMRVVIEYYEQGRIRTLSCTGSLADVEGEVRKLPEPTRDLARLALDRLRDLNETKPTSTPKR
jgi:hypothetical protein